MTRAAFNRDNVLMEEEAMSNKCPDCKTQLDFMSGEYPSGVVAPDGTELMFHEEGFFCSRCVHVWTAKELEDIEAIFRDVEEINATLPDLEPGVDALQRWLS